MAAIYREEILDIELESGSIQRSFMHMAIGAGDGNGNRFGLRLLRNGQPVSVSGVSCVGYFVRADGITLILNGTASAGILYVTLPAAAYAVEGVFTLAIKAAGTGIAETMRIIDGTVVRTTTGSINDPSGVVPSLAALTAIINRAETAADKIDSLSVSAIQITGTRYKISVTTD